MDPCLAEQLALSVLLMNFCPFPEPWRTWKIIPLSSPPWDPSTTSFHSVWRGCLGWLHQDHLRAPYRCNTSRGCRWGVLTLVIPAVSLQSGPVLLLVPGVGNFIQIWWFFLKLTFWNWHQLSKGSLLSPLHNLSRIYLIFFTVSDLFLFCKSLRKVFWIYSLVVISAYQLRKLNCELFYYCWKEF